MQLMVTVGLLTALFKECISKAGFTGNTHPLLLDATEAWGERREKEGGQDSKGSEETGGVGLQTSSRDATCMQREMTPRKPKSEMINNVEEGNKGEKQMERE